MHLLSFTLVPSQEFHLSLTLPLYRFSIKPKRGEKRLENREKVGKAGRVWLTPRPESFYSQAR